MPEIVQLPGHPPIPVTLRRAAGLRRMSLRVSGLDQRVTLSVPRLLPQRQALAFLAEKEGWVRAALARAPEPAIVGIGTLLPLHGRDMPIVMRPGPSVALSDGAICVPPDPTGQRTGARVAAFLRERARGELLAASERHADRIGRSFRAMNLRDTRSRWGSCTADGRLMYSWRLIMAPPEVLDYVAAHEVAHLVHMDHSPAYWDCVGKLLPDYATHRAWLRAHGARLHGFVFASAGDGQRDNGYRASTS